MKLFLMRHDDAEAKQPGKTDADRKLTDKGEKHTAEQAKRLVELRISFDLILSSPYVRACQTASIVARELGLVDAAAKEESLSSGCTPEDIMELASSYNNLDSLLLVGHEPDLGQAVMAILELKEPYAFMKGQIVGIDLFNNQKFLELI
ncbi:MAG: phosphohistidine phosphatase SixA [Candidatus Margulisiibacteriota bacterium]